MITPTHGYASYQETTDPTEPTPIQTSERPQLFKEESLQHLLAKFAVPDKSARVPHPQTIFAEVLSSDVESPVFTRTQVNDYTEQSLLASDISAIYTKQH